MKLWCFHIFAALSVLMFVGGAVYWVRSYQRWDYFGCSLKVFDLSMQSTRPGSVDVAYNSNSNGVRFSHMSGTAYTTFGSNGFDLAQVQIAGIGIGWPAAGEGGITWVRLPFWFVELACVIGPAWWIAGYRKRRNARLPGMCRQCGYDLRASKERCPECGAAIGEIETGVRQ